MPCYPLYSSLGRPQSRSGRVRKISPLTGIRSPDRPVISESLYRLITLEPPQIKCFSFVLFLVAFWYCGDICLTGNVLPSELIKMCNRKLFSLVARLLATSQYPEGPPPTGRLGTGVSC
jgi:hypothetical protein